MMMAMMLPSLVPMLLHYRSGAAVRCRPTPDRTQGSGGLAELGQSCLKTGSPNLERRSAIIGPHGSYIVDPLFDEESILIGELDLNGVDRERMTLDVFWTLSSAP